MTRVASDLPSHFAAAWNCHDMAALAELFSPNARFVNVVGAFWKSRFEILVAHEASHAGMFRSSLLTVESSELTEIDASTAAQHVHWKLEGVVAPDGTALPARKGIMLFVSRDEANGVGASIVLAQNTDKVAVN